MADPISQIDPAAVRAAVLAVEHRIRDLYNTGGWLHAQRTSYAEFKAHAAATWLPDVHGDALRLAAYKLWDAHGGDWAYVPVLERMGENAMGALLADCADLNKNPWDPDAGNYFPNYDDMTVDVYTEENAGEQDEQ
jgi:hypothetical protein